MMNSIDRDKVKVPYVYREFPKMLYDWNGKHRVVESREAQDALGDGWHGTPNPPAEASPAVEPAAETSPEGASAPDIELPVPETPKPRGRRR